MENQKILLTKAKYLLYQGIYYCSEIRYIFNL